MKKTIAAVFIVGIMLGVGLFCFTNEAHAGGLWSMMKNSGLEVREPTSFTIEVEGTNIRAYVFDVPEMKSICISVWGSSTQQLECKTYKEISEEE